jgi:uncharacterized membrane protein YkvA (DUF1232 family)
MSWWLITIIASVVGLLIGGLIFVIWLKRQSMSPSEGVTYLRELGIDIVRLPGRLRRVASDPRTPRKARWWLIGLAIYIANPIDPIPDFIPVIGYLDEVILVPLILIHIRRMIPPEVWSAYFPEKPAPDDGDEAPDVPGVETPG